VTSAMNAPPLRASGKVVPVARSAAIGPPLAGLTKKVSATERSGVGAVRADDRLVRSGVGRRCWPTHRGDEGTGLQLLRHIIQYRLVQCRVVGQDHDAADRRTPAERVGEVPARSDED